MKSCVIRQSIFDKTGESPCDLEIIKNLIIISKGVHRQYEYKGVVL